MEVELSRKYTLLRRLSFHNGQILSSQIRILFLLFLLLVRNLKLKSGSLFKYNYLIIFFPKLISHQKVIINILGFVYRFILTIFLVYVSDGFAFSQEEGGAVAQSDVIRAYNTNLPKPGGM